jgi:hypothetical protein
MAVVLKLTLSSGSSAARFYSFSDGLVSTLPGTCAAEALGTADPERPKTAYGAGDTNVSRIAVQMWSGRL